MQKKLLEQMTATIAYREAKQAVNKACNHWFYQPKFPDAVRNLKKHHA